MSVYASQVDDHGIDFVAEGKDGFLKFQVKSVRENTKYALSDDELKFILDC